MFIHSLCFLQMHTFLLRKCHQNSRKEYALLEFQRAIKTGKSHLSMRKEDNDCSIDQMCWCTKAPLKLRVRSQCIIMLLLTINEASEIKTPTKNTNPDPGPLSMNKGNSLGSDCSYGNMQTVCEGLVFTLMEPVSRLSILALSVQWWPFVDLI